MIANHIRPWKTLAVLVLVAVLAACATKPAPNFRGRWQPVNRFAEVPTAIPLYESFVYAPSPLDKTLKGMLTRWAQASKRTVSYLHSSDYTLFAPVESIQTTNLEHAIGQLNSAYAPYDVAISVEAGQITVRRAQPAFVEPASP